MENGKAQAANFPFCTIEPNVGIVAVPDPRLNVLSELSKSQRAVPASIEFVDIAGLVKGASQGEVMLFVSYCSGLQLMSLLEIYSVTNARRSPLLYLSLHSSISNEFATL